MSRTISSFYLAGCHRAAFGYFSSATKCLEKGDRKGLELAGGGGGMWELCLLAPTTCRESRLRNTNTPCHIARVGVTGSAGYSYAT